MAKVTIKWNLDGFADLRRDPKLDELLSKTAEDVASDANTGSRKGGYLAKQGRGKTRSRAAVLTSTPAAMADNAKYHRLLNALTQNVGKR